MITRLRTPGDDAGVGLVELLVAIAIMGVLGGSIASVAVSSFRTERVVVDARSAMDDARLSLERLRREIREAREIKPGSGTTTIILWVDDDRDDVEDAAEVLTYSLVDDATGASGCGNGIASPGSAVLTRRAGSAAAQTVACELRFAPAFTYTGAPVRQVQLSLTAEARIDGDGVSTIEVDDVIRIRNVS